VDVHEEPYLWSAPRTVIAGDGEGEARCMDAVRSNYISHCRPSPRRPAMQIRRAGWT